MLWNETFEIQHRLISGAGLAERDDARDEAWEKREREGERVLVEKYVAGLSDG